MSRSAQDILADLVAFDTTSRNSNLPLIAWVEDYLAGFGVRGLRVYDPTGQKANLWATIGPADVPGYILSGHTDTVPVDGQAWTVDPFRLTERDGRLYGRGTTDMKGFLAAVLAKVPDMTAAKLKTPVHLCFSNDEEVGCIGVRDLLVKLGEVSPVTPRACFVGEPTEMQVITAHKGKHTYTATVRGKPCHSSLAPHGVNAIDFAAAIVMKIKEIARGLATEGLRDPMYDVPWSTAHSGVIDGGTVLNIVPERCVVHYEFRMLPGQDHEPLQRELEAYARAVLEPEMHRVDPATGIDFHLVVGHPGFDMPLDAEVTTMAKRLAGRNDHAKVAYGTEAGLFVHHGVPSIVVGPGSIEQAHKPDEYIAMSELAKCGAFIDRLIAECR